MWLMLGLPLDALGSVAFSPVKNDLSGNIKVRHCLPANPIYAQQHFG